MIEHARFVARRHEKTFHIFHPATAEFSRVNLLQGERIDKTPYTCRRNLLRSQVAAAITCNARTTSRVHFILQTNQLVGIFAVSRTWMQINLSNLLLFTHFQSNWTFHSCRTVDFCARLTDRSTFALTLANCRCVRFIFLISPERRKQFHFRMNFN